MEEIVIRPIEIDDLEAIQAFGNRWIGPGYFTREELQDYYEASFIEGKCTSFVAHNQELVGIRLTLAPGKWPSSREGVAYFKSLFIAQKYQGRGLGAKLSHKSLAILKEGGAKAVLCHSWLESPHNSSLRYLEKLGFFEVGRHPEFWKNVDYHCVRCAPERCLCTAVEMLKILE